MAANLPWFGADGLQVGWLNAYRMRIVPFIADGLTIVLFVQCFKDLSADLLEAARVEEATVGGATAA